MKIGIIGAGNIGAALTRHFARLEHEVVEGIEKGLLESRWVEQRLGHSVIKVFNNSGALRPKVLARLNRRRKTGEAQSCAKRRLDTRQKMAETLRS